MQTDRIAKRLQTRYLINKPATLDEALKISEDAPACGETSIRGLLGNICEFCRDAAPLESGQTLSRSDLCSHPVNGTCRGLVPGEMGSLRTEDPKQVATASRTSMDAPR